MRVSNRSFALCLFAVVIAAAPLAAQTVQLTKKVSKVNGVSVNSNPSTINNGDVLDWVLTYQYNPTSAPPAQADIKDLLQPSLQYVPNSLKVPPSWKGQWYNGSWVAAEPAGVTGVGAVTAPNLVPSGVGQTALIPAPAAASISTASGGGDGYRAIPFNGKIYVINHHITGQYLNCFDAGTGAQCPGFPVHVPLASVATNLQTGVNNNGDNVTPLKTYEYLDRTTGKLYFAVQKTASPYDFGVLCANLLTMQTCGFTSVGTFGSTAGGFGWFQGVGGVNGKVYVQLPTGKLGCVDTATGATCPGHPFTLIPALNSNNVNQVRGVSEIVGTNIYTMWQMSGAGYQVTCWNAANDTPCSNAWPKIPNPAGTYGNLYRLLNPAGTTTGICAATASPQNNVVQCYDLTPAGAVVSPPPSFASWMPAHGGTLLASWTLGQAGYFGSRVFSANLTSTRIDCYDFATQAQCPEPGWATAPPNFTSIHYATIADPDRQGCMWSYGDDGKLSAFLAADKKPCGTTTGVKVTITPSESYCATGGNISGWDQLLLNGIAVGGGTTAILTLRDANGNLAVQANGITPYAQNLAVTSFPLNLGSGGLGIGYGNGPGQYTTLQVELTFSGLTGNAAWTQNPPPSIEVTWKGGPPEFCFRTKVVGCANPTVTNQATAVTTPFNGPAINSASNPPFSATHSFGGECPAKLTIVKSVPGAPAGYIGTFTFNVTCGLVQQQVSITWPNTTVTLSNVAPSTCTVSENPLLPALPSGYLWSGVPVVTPAGGVVQIPAGGSGQVSFANHVRRCNDKGAVRIEKKVQGVPPGFSGTFHFNVACWSGSTLITQQAQITLPNQSSVTVTGIPTGSTCTITETGPLPPLPPGWFWEAPLYQPASGQVSLIGTCCPTITVIDRAKFCCDEVQASSQPENE